MQELMLMMAKLMPEKEIAKQLEKAAKDYIEDPSAKKKHCVDVFCFVWGAKIAMQGRSVEACSKEIDAVGNFMELIKSDKIKQQ